MAQTQRIGSAFNLSSEKCLQTKSLSQTGITTANSASLVLGKASATLLQRIDEKLDTALTFEVTGAPQLVKIIGELLGRLTEIERFEGLLVVCLRSLGWRRSVVGRRRTDTFPGCSVCFGDSLLGLGT